MTPDRSYPFKKICLELEDLSENCSQDSTAVNSTLSEISQDVESSDVPSQHIHSDNYAQKSLLLELIGDEDSEGSYSQCRNPTFNTRQSSQDKEYNGYILHRNMTDESIDSNIPILSQHDEETFCDNVHDFFINQKVTEDNSLCVNRYDQSMDSCNLPYCEADYSLDRSYSSCDKEARTADTIQDFTSPIRPSTNYLLMQEEEETQDCENRASNLEDTADYSLDRSYSSCDKEARTADTIQDFTSPIRPSTNYLLMQEEEETQDCENRAGNLENSLNSWHRNKSNSTADFQNDGHASSAQTPLNCSQNILSHWRTFQKEAQEEDHTNMPSQPALEEFKSHYQNILEEDLSRSPEQVMNRTVDSDAIAQQPQEGHNDSVYSYHSQPNENEVSKSFNVDSVGSPDRQSNPSMGKYSSPLHTPQKDLFPPSEDMFISPIKSWEPIWDKEQEQDASDESGESDVESDGDSFDSLSSFDLNSCHGPPIEVFFPQGEGDLDIDLEEEVLGEQFGEGGQVEFETDHANESPYASVLNNARSFNNLKVHDACELSVNEGILNIMDLYLKNSQSKADLKRSIDTICQFLPENHLLPSNCHYILKYINSLSPPMNSNAHYYCKECLFYYGTDDKELCEICREPTKSGKFFEFDMAVIIKYLFECRNLASIIDRQHERHTAKEPHTGYEDVQDGSAYKTQNVNRNKYDLNFIVNTDGVRIRKSSTKELWLIMICPVEVPLHLRKSFTLVVGVWYDTEKPEMNAFMKPFAEKMKFLFDVGVEWTHPETKQTYTSKANLLLIVADAPARAMVQNVMRYNSRYGCNMCEIKTVRTARIPNKKRLRVYKYKHNVVLRTKDNMLTQAELAVASGKPVRGVKGPSVLNLVPSADCAASVIPEFMHSVLLGVEKQLVSIWIYKPGEWSISVHIPEIDRLLSDIKHPDFVHRGTRALKSFKFWKASDFYYFLLFESLVVLHRYLPQRYFQHYILFVKGIFMLLQSNISENDLAEANLLLRLFVNRFGNIYGERQLTHNVHQLCHLSLCVQRYGPLFANNAFPFEDINGLIAKRTHGSNQMDIEIVNNIRICQGIQMLRNIVQGHNHANANDPSTVVELLGAPTNFLLSPEIREVIGSDKDYKVFARAKIGYNTYSSELHKLLKSSNFYAMWEEEFPRYGSIKYFVQTTNSIFVCLQEFRVDQLRTFYNQETLKSITHIIPVVPTENTIVKNVSDISTSFVKVGRVGSFLYKRPNLYHHVL